MKLHSYQRRTTLAIWASFRRGNRRVLFTLPTGTGKTVVLAHMIRQWIRKGLRILFLAHTKEIIEQTVETLEAYGLDPATISVIMRKHPRENLSLPVQVASRDTLARRREMPDCDVVVIDEAHHAVSATYRRLVALYPKALVLGATATPFRSNGEGLDADFDELVVGAKPSELVPRFMSKARIWSIPEGDLKNLRLKLKKVGTVGGDYNRSKLGRAMNKSKLVGDIVQHCRRIGLGHPTVVYAVTLAHARRILKAFRKDGWVAELVHATTPREEREAMLARLASGETQVVVNCMILTEGWNSPVVKRIVLARPTRSPVLFLQILGRGLRPGVDCIVLDHSGSTHRFGFPHLDREMTLEGVERDGGGQAPLKQCPACNAIVAAGSSKCPECGSAFEMSREPKEVAGDLNELDADRLAAVLKRDADRLAKLVAGNEKMRTVAIKVYEGRHGVRPWV